MKNQSLKEMLIDTPETKPEVSPELHQKIMRAVRLTASQDKRVSSGRSVSKWSVSKWSVSNWRFPAWTVPAWGAGVAVLALTMFYLVQTAPGIPAQSASAQSSSLAQTQKPAPVVPQLVLGDRLAAFSEDTLLPEKELMEEFERLKSDLKRLGFSS